MIPRLEHPCGHTVFGLMSNILVVNKMSNSEPKGRIFQYICKIRNAVLYQRHRLGYLNYLHMSITNVQLINN